jgi:hypothetical protein
LNRDLYILLGLLGVAVLVYLVIAGLVYASTRRHAKRYRPGRPFEFTPVWFLAPPERQATSARTAGRELTRATAGPPATRRPRQTGGASDGW